MALDANTISRIAFDVMSLKKAGYADTQIAIKLKIEPYTVKVLEDMMLTEPRYHELHRTEVFEAIAKGSTGEQINVHWYATNASKGKRMAVLAHVYELMGVPFTSLNRTERAKIVRVRRDALPNKITEVYNEIQKLAAELKTPDEIVAELGYRLPALNCALRNAQLEPVGVILQNERNRQLGQDMLEGKMPLSKIGKKYKMGLPGIMTIARKLYDAGQLSYPQAAKYGYRPNLTLALMKEVHAAFLKDQLGTAEKYGLSYSYMVALPAHIRKAESEQPAVEAVSPESDKTEAFKTLCDQALTKPEPEGEEVLVEIKGYTRRKRVTSKSLSRSVQSR